MKKLVIFLFITLWANETEDILKLIDKIENYKFHYTYIKKLYDPFGYKRKILHHKVTITKKKVIKNNSYNLQIVFQNRVKINNKWYNIGDKIGNYTIVKKNGQIMLVNKYSIIKLSQPSLIKVN